MAGTINDTAENVKDGIRKPMRPNEEYIRDIICGEERMASWLYQTH